MSCELIVREGKVAIIVGVAQNRSPTFAEEGAKTLAEQVGLPWPMKLEWVLRPYAVLVPCTGGRSSKGSGMLTAIRTAKAMIAGV